MPAPINYTLPQTNPLQSILGGYQVGQGLLAQQDEQAAAEIKAAQARQMQSEMLELSSNPNASLRDYSSMIAKYPSLSEHYKRGADLLSEAQKQERLSNASQVYSAVKAGRTDLAKDILSTQVTAAENSGDEETARGAKLMRDMLEDDPQSAMAGLAGYVVANADKEALDALQSAEGQAATLREGAAKASLAEQKAATFKSDREFTQSIKKEENKIKAMEARLKRETNDLKSQELQQKIEEKKISIEGSKKEAVEQAETAFENTNNALTLSSDILENVDIDSITGVSALVPTISPESQDSLNKITQLKNLLTLDNLKLMTGVLTDRDIQVLSSAASGLIVDEKGVKGSAEGVKKQLQKIKEVLEGKLSKAKAARDNVKSKYGVGEAAQQGENRNIVVDY